jgi:hypothetical protein
VGSDKGQIGVFAILRYDGFHRASAPPHLTVTVKEIVASLELAESEVARLNGLREGSDIQYWWQSTRMYSEGTAAGGSAGRVI